ncbi:hypothetical protein RI367_002603 [Sorochytrium milnesiophthora]
MKAIQVKSAGGPEQLQEVHDAVRPACGSQEILVHNEYAGVNFVDTMQRNGTVPLSFPTLLGCEGAGVIEEVGSEVDSARFKVGDRVAYLASPSYAEYTAVPVARATLLPSWASTELGAAALAHGLTACALTQLAYKVQRGDTVLVHAAAGGCGKWLVQICHRLGARVLATVSTEEKARMVRALGADEIILYSSENVAERVKKLTGGQGVHCVYDGVGKSTFDASLASLRSRGVLVLFGNSSGPVPDFNLLRLLAGNTAITMPSLYGYIQTQDEFDELCTELYALLDPSKQKQHTPVQVDIFQTYPLTTAGTQQAHRDLESRGTTGKLLLRVGSSADDAGR